MEKFLLFLILNFVYLISFSQESFQSGKYIITDQHPYGRIADDAPKQILDFNPMIGICDCQSIQRNQDGSWQDTLQMVWKFKYILNGTAVQDETWHEDGSAATSIRQYNTDSMNWVVSYYGSRNINNVVKVWTGGKEGDNIVLTMPQKAPNGMDGINRLTFYDISEDGFNWIGEWINPDQTIVYPFWKIYCVKRK